MFLAIKKRLAKKPALRRASGSKVTVKMLVCDAGIGGATKAEFVIHQPHYDTKSRELRNEQEQSATASRTSRYKGLLLMTTLPL
jgi:hypothetical protein